MGIGDYIFYSVLVAAYVSIGFSALTALVLGLTIWTKTTLKIIACIGVTAWIILKIIG